MSSREAAIDLKVQKAKALFAEVDVLFKLGFYITVINRLYHACFHMTRALLLTKDIILKTHSGVVAQLHEYFVQNGLFETSHAAFFSRLMQERTEDDYGDFMTLNKEDVKSL